MYVPQEILKINATEAQYFNISTPQAIDKVEMHQQI